MKQQDKVKILKKVYDLIETKRDDFICHAFDRLRKSETNTDLDVVSYLQKMVSMALSGNSERCCAVETWMWRNHPDVYLSIQKSNQPEEGYYNWKQYRLEWIKEMINQVKAGQL